MQNQQNKPLVTLKEKQEKAAILLDTFSQFTNYKHGSKNPYLNWLNTNPELKTEQVVNFLCFWYSVSRHQPQILLRCAAAYIDQTDRKLMMQNYLEEDGMVHHGDDPHYDLLENLIHKLGGRLTVDMQAENLINRFHNELYTRRITPAQATGLVAGIEHPALDISAYLHKTIQLCGFSDLLASDLYLTIHVNVEPDHIIWSHSNALRYMEDGKRDEVVQAFRKVMSFWENFWPLAFSKVNYFRTSQADTSDVRGLENLCGGR